MQPRDGGLFPPDVVGTGVIVTETADGYRFVTQPAHADLAGRFADRWGAGRFERPEPRAAVLMAASNHDVGWWDYDLRPHLDADGDPIDFRDTPAAVWIDLYEDGIETVVDLDPYAGLLASMHGSGLRRRRYGLSPSWNDTPAAYEAFVEREERRQERLVERLRDSQYPVSGGDVALLRSLHETGEPPEGDRGRLWRNYQLLQAWDALSLSLCTTESPPADDELDAVPTTEGDETLSIERLAPDEFRIDPYPFESSPLVGWVPTRRVRRHEFDDEADLVRAYYEADRTLRTFAFRGAAG